MKIPNNPKLDPILFEWLLETFFSNSDSPGWRGIAEKLITKGTVLTPESGRTIWAGEVNNFIEKETSEEGEEVIRMTFDLEYFLTSKVFESSFRIFQLEKAQKELEIKYKELEKAKAVVAELNESRKEAIQRAKVSMKKNKN